MGAGPRADCNLFVVSQQPYETLKLTAFAAEEVGALGKEAPSIGPPAQEQRAGHSLRAHTLSSLFPLVGKDPGEG